MLYHFVVPQSNMCVISTVCVYDRICDYSYTCPTFLNSEIAAVRTQLASHCSIGSPVDTVEPNSCGSICIWGLTPSCCKFAGSTVRPDCATERLSEGPTEWSDEGLGSWRHWEAAKERAQEFHLWGSFTCRRQRWCSTLWSLKAQNHRILANHVNVPDGTTIYTWRHQSCKANQDI